MNPEGVYIDATAVFTPIDTLFSGRGLTGGPIVLDTNKHTRAKASSADPRGDIEPKNKILNPNANSERPTLSDGVNMHASTAEEIAKLSIAVNKKIKEQEALKEALLEKFKTFTKLCIEFRDAQAKVTDTLTSELPGHAKIPELFDMARNTVNTIMNDLQHDFFAAIDTKINAIKADLDYNYATRAQLTKFMTVAFQMTKKGGDVKPIANACAVCYDRQVDGCLIPCGHTFCMVCSDTLNQCPMCNTGVQSRVKIFLST